MIQSVKRVRFQRLLDAMQQFHVAGIIKIANAQQSLSFVYAFFGQNRRMVLFIDHVVAGLFVFFQLFTANKLWNNRVRLVVLVGRLFGWTRDDQRSARFVDQDRIDFINDRVIMAALYTRREIELHVVAQIVEAELVIGSVGDVGSVRC